MGVANSKFESRPSVLAKGKTQLRKIAETGKLALKGTLKPLKKVTWIAEPARRHFYFTDFTTFEQAAHSGKNTCNLRVLSPARKVHIASPETDPFVPIGRMFRDGSFERPEIFVCEVPDAYLCAGNGIVCTREQEVLADIEPRMQHFKHNAYKKPAAIRYGLAKPLPKGLYTTINGIAAGNFYHWMIDCLPKLHSLAKYAAGEKVTVIMPETLGPIQRESLMCVLPPTFVVEYFPPKTWLRVPRFLLPSLVSGYYNGMLPAEYYDAIRKPTFARYGLDEMHEPRERLYICRRNARCRQVLNEEAVLDVLRPYGFKAVELDKLSFREQVELFHRAEIVLGPSGAGFNLMLFAGNIDIVVLHPNRTPDNFFHTIAQGMLQRYHFVLHDRGPDDNFEVDLEELQRMLDFELGLKAKPSSATQPVR